MLIKSFVLLSVFFAVVVRSARLPRNIPVEIRYDEITGKDLKQQESAAQQEADLQEIGCSKEEILQKLKGQQEEAPAQAVVATVTEDLGNVRDSLAQETLKQEIASVQPEKATTLPEENAEILPASNPIKNLEEKPQLSSQQQKEALKHLPEQEKQENTISLKKLDGNSFLPDQEKQENTISLKKLGANSSGNQLEDFQNVIKQAQDIVSNGLKRIKDFAPEKGQISLNPQQWQDLEKVVDEYFDEEKAKLTLKQTSPGTNATNQNFFANLASGFQTIATNFVQSIQGSANSSGSADEAGGSSPGGWQGFVSFFQGGVQSISNSINNLGQSSTTSNTVLGDSGSTTESQGIFSNFVNNIQQGVQTFIGQIQNSGAAPGGTQGDPGSNATVANQGPIQTGIQQIGTAISNFIQNNRPPGTSGDEATGGNNTTIIQTIGNAIQQLNPFRPGEQGSQGAQGAIPGIQGQNPAEGIQSGIQNIGNQIQQLAPGQQASTEGSKKPEDSASPAVVTETQQQQQEQQPQQEQQAQQNEATEPKPTARSGLSLQGVGGDSGKKEILVTVE